MEIEVAIAGGGLGGLALVIALNNVGVNAHVFEAFPELRTESGTLVGLGNNAFAALSSIDSRIPGAIKAVGALTRTVHGVSRPHGRAEVVEVNNPPGDLCTIRWGAVQEVLANLVPKEKVHCSHRLTGYEEHEDGTVTVQFKDQPSIRAKVLVGADGVNSAVRAVLAPGDKPRYLGHMNWNAVVHNPGSEVTLLHGPLGLKFIRDGASFGDLHQLQVFLIDAGCGYTFWQVRMQSNEPSFTGPNSTGGMGVPGSKARLIKLLLEFGWEDVKSAVEATPEESIYERAMWDRLPLQKWSSPGGSVVLMGDAAHAMHSGPGQGARMAFEDAHQLMLCIKECPGDYKRAIQEYEVRRIERANKAQAYALEHCGLEHLKANAALEGLSPIERALRFREFMQWLNAYPAYAAGDPNTKYWKPDDYSSLAVPQHGET